MIVDNAIYVDGRRSQVARFLEQLMRRAAKGMDLPGSGCTSRARRSSSPSAGEFDLHELAVEDAVTAHQRPKIEQYGDSVFVCSVGALQGRDGDV
jgi:magnesium transporter